MPGFKRPFPSRKWLKMALADAQAEVVRLRDTLALQARYHDDMAPELIRLRAQTRAQADTIASLDRENAAAEEAARLAHMRGDALNAELHTTRTIADVYRKRDGRNRRAIRTLWASRRQWQEKVDEQRQQLLESWLGDDL